VLPWEQVKELFTPLFTTLNLVHQAGIIHRGISPSTILFNDKNELVLINFNITAARTYGSEINHEVFTGYAAPEQYNGAARHGSWTDVYGMTAVLYKVLTGQMPINAPSRRNNEDSEDSLTEPALINRNVPQSVSAAMMKALELDVDQRTQSVNSLIRGLFETAPVSVPDSTNEILIKKPPRKPQAEETFRASAAKGKRRKPEQRRSVPVLPIVSLAVFVIVVIGLIVLMFNNDGGGGSNENGNNGGGGILPPIEQDPTPPVTTQPVDNDTPRQPPEQQPGNEPLFTIPNLVGRRFESITFDFLVFNPIYEFSYEHDEGFIFEQDIEEGQDVVAGTEITLTVSKGPATVELPSYGGVLLSDFERILGNEKIKYETEGEYSSSVMEGFVIRCSVNGRAVTMGDTISIENVDTVRIYFSLGIDPATLIEDPPEEPPPEDPAPPEESYGE
jgi:serine/threonine-protein kinase